MCDLETAVRRENPMCADEQMTMIPMLPFFGEPKWIFSAAEQGSSRSQPLNESKKIKVIAIDDEPLIAETVVEILNDEGFQATAVSNGASALELARELQPDIVLSDVIMPGLNGIETGICIREIVPSCRVILFSGQAATVDLLEKARYHKRVFR
jgi:CheY-like chemotaxis protein